ncbi:ABC-2 type transport system permease protein [Geodermatophilus saharensis]|uniref:ABC-2 type transport system permease protein n=1 Tax=Geodermatophilus saharensis TaxID=1137994 RepID=A0A239IIH6_9ACTN|nr:ABC transporter permease [Geodermatophilus saharensis]SNS93329.1 ABC-2 type transport system permease protein [Geodermatophilus saharensis]
MSATRTAVGLGVRRGWTEFLLSLRSPQDQGFYLFVGGGTLLYLWFNRDEQLEGTGISLVAYSLPSVLAALLAFGVVVGPAFSLAMEREDGTLLRHKALPHGMQGYVTGQLVYHSLGLLPMLLVILVPSFLLFDGVMERGAEGWLTVAWVVALGLLATLPLGMVIGSLVPSTQKVTTWGMLPVIVVTAISGIFFPVQALWGWVQGLAQVFPTYWIGLGMRSAFLPDAAAAVELGDSWRTGTTVLVLAAWAVAGLLVTPRVLRRMARRQSGSQVAAARDAAAQWVR